MTKKETKAYEEGNRDAWRQMLSVSLKHLGYDSPEARANGWAVEREQAIAQLRILCAQHGDNDWPEDLHLADIIGKHLSDHLDR